MLTAGHQLLCFYGYQAQLGPTSPILLHTEGAITQFTATWTPTPTGENMTVVKSTHTPTHTHANKHIHIGQMAVINGCIC